MIGGVSKVRREETQTERWGRAERVGQRTEDKRKGKRNERIKQLEW